MMWKFFAVLFVIEYQVFLLDFHDDYDVVCITVHLADFVTCEPVNVISSTCKHIRIPNLNTDHNIMETN